MSDAQDSEAPSEVRSLYRVAGVAALSAALVFRRSCGAEHSAFNGFGVFAVPHPLPSQAGGWFALLQADPFVGMALLDALDLIEYLLLSMVFVALFCALRGAARTASLVASVLGLVGIGVAFLSNAAFSMLSLSQRYGAAEEEADRLALLAAGEAVLARSNPGAAHLGTGAMLGWMLVLLAGLLFSVAMLRTQVFSKATGISGTLANGFGLLVFPVLLLAPSVVWLPPSLSAPFRLLWYILIALRLFKLSRGSQRGAEGAPA
jgi:hypothetical protein